MSSYNLDGSSVTKEGTEKQGVREIIREELRAYLQDPLGFPEEFKGWLPEWIGQVGIDLPISQVIGFSQFAPQRAIISTSNNTTSTTYVDLATVGPTLSNLPNGKYLVIVTAYMMSSVTTAPALMSPSFNGSAPATADAAICVSTTEATHIGVSIATLAAANNEIKAKYRVDAGATGFFQFRQLVALRMSN